MSRVYKALTKTYKPNPVVAVLFLTLLLLAAAWLNNILLYLLIGIFFFWVGWWGFRNAPAIWRLSLRRYKKLPQNKRSFWSQPRYFAYVLNRYLIFPLFMLAGVGCFYIGYLLARGVHK